MTVQTEAVTIEIKLVYSVFRPISLFVRETEQFSDRRTQAMANNKSEPQKSISIHTAITPKNNFVSVIPTTPHPSPSTYCSLTSASVCSLSSPFIYHRLLLYKTFYWSLHNGWTSVFTQGPHPATFKYPLTWQLQLRPVYVGFVVDKMAQGLVIFQVLRCFCVSIILPMLLSACITYAICSEEPTASLNKYVSMSHTKTKKIIQFTFVSLFLWLHIKYGYTEEHKNNIIMILSILTGHVTQYCSIFWCFADRTSQYNLTN